MAGEAGAVGPQLWPAWGKEWRLDGRQGMLHKGQAPPKGPCVPPVLGNSLETDVFHFRTWGFKQYLPPQVFTTKSSIDVFCVIK